ncbi:hypothetical protein DPMN_168637 [Dreissena polymorpha]|uniref:Uncharacterized protein n=1 Tax=Dreissena polymorpha TaxID=45954 RepID=A0A9D4F3R0_DREPO|nr:hypothetical protein DPMN_168637 [Dreissena polymorpha]
MDGYWMTSVRNCFTKPFSNIVDQTDDNFSFWVALAPMKPSLSYKGQLKKTSFFWQCTHYHQPLDRTVFGPPKRAYNDACLTFFTENPLHQITKYYFPSLFSRAWNNAVNYVNIQNGFQ